MSRQRKTIYLNNTVQSETFISKNQVLIYLDFVTRAGYVEGAKNLYLLQI